MPELTQDDIEQKRRVVRQGLMRGTAAFRPGEPKPENPFTTEPQRSMWEAGYEDACKWHAGQQN